MTASYSIVYYSQLHKGCLFVLLQFVEKFNEAKESAKLLLEERKIAAKKELEQDKPQPPADTPISPPNKSFIQSPPPPPILSPKAIRGQEEQKINGSEPSFEKSQIKINGAPAEVCAWVGLPAVGG